MEHTFRGRVGLFLRQLSVGHEKKSNTTPCTSPTSTGSFIHKYLLGEVIREHPRVYHAKSCYDLPVKKVAYLSKAVLAAYTGPSDGLTAVDSSEKPFESPDADVYFIDDDNQENCENADDLASLGKEEDKTKCQMPKDMQSEIAGIKDWNNSCDSAYGIATTLYECHPVTKQNAGDPIADAFAIVMRENSALLVLADGVNWGEKSCLAARCAVHGCIDYLNKALYREGSRNDTTLVGYFP